jgi:hypothetical protein
MARSPAELVRAFYELRKKNEPELLRPLLSPTVRWCEPEVGQHMGVLEGVDAVIDMVHRALAATDGTFSLSVIETVETETHGSAVIAWSAQKGGMTITGHELAVYGFKNGLIHEAYFFASNIANDEAFWALPAV